MTQLGKYCAHCRAIPAAGYCALPGCPMLRPTDQRQGVATSEHRGVAQAPYRSVPPIEKP